MMFLILLLDYAFIFLARVLDMTLATVRILMVMRGKPGSAAGIGFFESIIYILALARVIDTLDNPTRLIVYALGFAAGNYAGTKIEEMLALGFSTAQVISRENAEELTEKLRENGFGVTVLEGCGREGSHQLLHVLLKRKDIPVLMSIIRDTDEHAFVSVFDTRKILGGYFRKIKSK
ncbi:DUF2179 domain-containing protein [Dethiobacter alkaliphilus]|uniref:DUF2179 domain-containing protein n=1 Tax=Dethiobacter alkaliphilus TaxID=427926 RepID=UPI002226622E|nr:DUF2179 domain-containing protein [Dethiobacter alkaliphilus]MCW3491390.1 DUF2179 domain-containing protein [Dethiobacter alkaliphilus]